MKASPAALSTAMRFAVPIPALRGFHLVSLRSAGVGVYMTRRTGKTIAALLDDVRRSGGV